MFYTNENCFDVYILLWPGNLFYVISIHFSTVSSNHFVFCLYFVILLVLCFVFCFFTCIHILLGLIFFNAKSNQLPYPLVLLQLFFFSCSHFDLLFCPLEFSAIFCHFLEHAGTMEWLFDFFVSPQKSDIFSAVKLRSCCTEGKLITFSLRLPLLEENKNKSHHRGEFTPFAIEVIAFCVCVYVCVCVCACQSSCFRPSLLLSR